MFKIKQFIKEIINEFKKVEWSSRREVLILSFMVVLVSGIVSIYLGAFDLLFTTLLNRIGIL